MNTAPVEAVVGRNGSTRRITISFWNDRDTIEKRAGRWLREIGRRRQVAG